MRFLAGEWTRDLPHSKPALGYRGGGVFYWTPYIQTQHSIDVKCGLPNAR